MANTRASTAPMTSEDNSRLNVVSAPWAYIARWLGWKMTSQRMRVQPSDRAALDAQAEAAVHPAQCPQRHGGVDEEQRGSKQEERERLAGGGAGLFGQVGHLVQADQA